MTLEKNKEERVVLFDPMSQSGEDKRRTNVAVVMVERDKCAIGYDDWRRGDDALPYTCDPDGHE